MRNSNFRNIKALALLLTLAAVFAGVFEASATTNRQERRLVDKGNTLFRGGH